MITRHIGDAVARLGIDLNKIAEAPCSWSALGGKSAGFMCSWLEGRVFNRLSMSQLKGQQLVTFERCHLLETQSEVIYKVRLVTPLADLEKELTVPI